LPWKFHDRKIAGLDPQIDFMKTQVIILFLLAVHASAQNAKFPKVKITGPCSDEFINNYRGKWLNHEPISVTEYHDEVMKRFNAIQNLVRQTYPQPMGADVSWGGSFAKTSFADEVKYVPVKDRDPEETKTRINPVYRLTFGCTLCPWSCTDNPNEISNGYPEIGGAGLKIDANWLYILHGTVMGGSDEWTIDGRPIKTKMFKIGNWKGYDVLSDVPANFTNQSSSYFVLISRDGMLPYIPITRKQYLDQAIRYTTRFYDDLNKKSQENNDALPVQVRTPQQEIDNQKAQDTKAKTDALKKLHDELDKTTKEGLLDAPAVVRLDPLLMNEGPVFLPESEGGTLLATENPNYFRKDLPKYVPQFFILEVIVTDTKSRFMNFKRIIDDNFPIEKLKAIIDK
jgi:hypothetical protein